MVKAIEKKVEEENKNGIIIPKELMANELEDEQVASGVVMASATEEYEQGDVLFFHKVLPVDVNMKYDGNNMEKFWFIHPNDIIFKVEKE